MAAIDDEVGALANRQQVIDDIGELFARIIVAYQVLPNKAAAVLAQSQRSK